MDNMELDNPYSAGQYGAIQSSEDRDALFTGDDSKFDTASNRWFEDYWCGYSCRHNGRESIEWYYDDRAEFYSKRPQACYKESFYDLVYGETRNQIADVMFVLTETQGEKYRFFRIHLENITMKEFEEYWTAMENWHRTGKLNIGPYQGVPNYSHWHND